MKKILFAVILMLSFVMVISCAPVAEEVADEVVAEEAAADEIAEETTADSDLEVTEDEMIYVSTGDIDILGYDGFSVKAYTVSVGESITFVNMNTEDDPISDVTLTFQSQENKRNFETSSVIKMGQSYEHTFETAGEYIGWTVGYGVELPITVTE